MTAFVINLIGGLINLPIDSKYNKFASGFCLGISFILLCLHFGWVSTETAIFVGLIEG